MTAPKEQAPENRAATRGILWGIALLSIALTFLLIWLLGYFLEDIGDLRGPSYGEIEDRYVDQPLRSRVASLVNEIEGLKRKSARQDEIQTELSESMHNARGTMEQMMDLQRLALEQKAPPSQTEKEALATAQQRFLDFQEQFESANREIAAASEKRFQLEQEKVEIEKQLELQTIPAKAEFEEARKKHQFKVAALKLGFLVPVFLFASFLVMKGRHSPYRAILFAFLAATAWKLFSVMFDHFPREYFKYIAILAGIGSVIWFLIWLVRRATRPDQDFLHKRNREGYQNHRCPICSYPILRGALQLANWTRKGPVLSSGLRLAPDGSFGLDENYDCPSCGTSLFSTCPECKQSRHSLLPYCFHCGIEENKNDER